MKKIINGKRYDTDSAKEIGSFYNNSTGFDSLSETLYLKRTGEYFVYGEGGARTWCAVSYDNGNSWSGGKAIRPLTDAEAREWIEAHCSAETYEQLFDVVEDTGVADEIKALRKSTGLTQLEFCDKYGIPRSTLQSWEGGINCPPPYVVELLKYRVER